MKHPTLIVLAILILPSIAQSQNLIQNGSFEFTTGLIYTDPVTSVPYLDYWHRANFHVADPQFEGTPDLFDDNNRYPISDPLNFWNTAYGAAEGNYHIGIANLFNREGYLGPEAIGSPLSEPLEAGEFYHLEFSFRNKGTSGYNDFPPILCPPIDKKQIDILFGPDSLLVTIDALSETSYSNASQVVSLRTEEMASHFQERWQRIGTCFQATGDERYIGITLPTGSFGVAPGCSINEDGQGVYYVYYFDIDDLVLTKLPDAYELEAEICSARPTEVNVASMIDMPIMLNEVEYHWPDGQVDSTNFLSEGGTYRIEAIVDCTTIPITLEVTDLNCEPKVFVPNVFSPNDDGVNDQLEVFIAADLPVLDYQFSIFDRWGNQVFSTTDMTARWDGRVRGERLQNGVFIWAMEYTVDDIELGLTHYSNGGDVLLLR